MVAFLERFGIYARWPDARPLAEIAADIDDELAFHVEESARALEGSGLAPDAARAEALKRFGDYGRIRRECARTQMGERVMLQRIQLVLTATLVVAVGFMVMSARESRAMLEAERATSAALMARLEAQLARATAPDPHTAALGALAKAPAPADPDLNAVGYTGGGAPGEYVDASGRAAYFGAAANSWNDAFDEQSSSWRHGLKIAERLSALPDAQGAEILASIWDRIAVEHREQAMKPFVFGGGHPHALEVLALGIDAQQPPSVRERASTYFETYAFQRLLAGDGRWGPWLADWREKPVAEVLRANATRWARELGALVAEWNALEEARVGDLLTIVDHVRLDTFARAGVDLGAILAEQGVCRMTDAHLIHVSADTRARAQTVRGWCPK